MIKNFLLWIIRRYNLSEIIDQQIKNNNLTKCYQSVTNNGSVFYPESRVLNHNDDSSKIVLGNGSHIRGELLIFKYGGKIKVGNNCYVGEGTRIWSGEEIIIGNNVLISHNVNIVDTNSHELESEERNTRFRNLISNGHWENQGSIITSAITIKDDAWISFNCIILKGVTIGKGAIVAAGTLVTKDVPDFAVVGGNPATILKYTK